MGTPSSDTATIHALRSDVALQLARHVRRLGLTQIPAARRLGLPQPTLSKILNGHVSGISLELLIRTAARAGLPMTLQTGRIPQEAGAFVSGAGARRGHSVRSRLGEQVRESLNQSSARLTAAERVQAFLEHNQLLGALQQAGRAAEAKRRRKMRPVP